MGLDEARILGREVGHRVQRLLELEHAIVPGRALGVAGVRDGRVGGMRRCGRVTYGMCSLRVEGPQGTQSR